MKLPLSAVGVFGVLSSFYLSSYSSGLAANGNDGTSSGAPNSIACASCHRGGAFGTATSATLLGADGVPVEAYVPGQTYTLKIDIATATTPGGYGFQALVVDATRAQAGTFGAAPANTRVTELNDRSYFEHSRRLASGTQEIAWTAPASGTGSVTLYAVGNAVNGNGGTSGDLPDEAIVTFREGTASSTAESAWPAQFSVRTPGRGVVEIIATDDGPAETYTVELYDLSGRRQATGVLAKADEVTFGNLTAGIHVVMVKTGAGRVAGRTVTVLP